MNKANDEQIPTDPREAMRRLPAWSQPFLTLLTCKPCPGQGPGIQTPWTHLAHAVCLLIAGVYVSICGATDEWAWWLVPIGWGATVAGARKAQLVVVHMCAHEKFSDRAWLDRLLGRLISILLFLEPFDRYASGHRVHHSRKLSSHEDPTVIYLLCAGFRPGMRKRDLWRKLVVQSLSPFFHVRNFLGRVGSNFRRDSVWAGVGMTLYLTMIVVATIELGGLVVLASWIVPIAILYQISGLIRLNVEHIGWPIDPDQVNTPGYADRTTEIFLGEAPPRAGLRGIRAFSEWSLWSLRMCGHGLARWLVLAGDTPVHGAHHLFGGLPNYDWPNYLFERARLVAERQAAGKPPIPEVWGLINALDLAFETLSSDSAGFVEGSRESTQPPD